MPRGLSSAVPPLPEALVVGTGPSLRRLHDRNGVPLAQNQQNYRVVLVQERTPNVDATLTQLSHYVPLSESDRRRIVREIQRKRRFVPVTVKDNLTWDQVSLLEIYQETAIKEGFIARKPIEL